MADQFVVPQFLDVEAKIIGPITARQFAILLVTMLVDFILYRIFLSLTGILLFVFPMTVLGLGLAFAKVNGLPVHFLILNLIQTIRRPGLRVWDNTLSDRELKAILKKEDAQPPPPLVPVKSPLNMSRLEELALVVNTGGVYHPEENNSGKSL